MRIVYFGSDVYLSTFLYLAEHHKILALYTYHNDEDYFHEYTIVKEANKRNIPVHYEDITSNVIKKWIENDGCELFFSAEYNRIIPVPIDYDLFKGINIHASLLPQGRSYYPIEVAMDKQLLKTGVTLHKINAKLDQGDIIGQVNFEIKSEMDSIDIYLKCSKHALELVQGIFKDFEKAWSNAKKQEHTYQYKYWKRPIQEKLIVSHDLTCEEALTIFKYFNQMTEIKINENYYFIRSMMPGNECMDTDVCFIEEDKVLYRLKDGHIRLIVRKKDIK